MTHNTREGIEEKRYNPRQGGKEILTDKMIVEEVRKGDNYVIWKSPKTTVHIIPDGKLKEIFHQELQKARADSYVEGYVDGIGVSGLGMPEDKKEELRQTIIDRYQSELDQPKQE